MHPSHEGVDKGIAQCIQKYGAIVVVVKIQNVDKSLVDKEKIKDNLVTNDQPNIKSELDISEFEYVIEEELTKLSNEDKETINQLFRKTKEQ